MPKSKIILLCKFLLFFFVLFLIRIQFIIKEPILNPDEREFVGRVSSVQYNDDYIKLSIIVNKEKLSGNLYNSDIKLEYNDLVKVNGTLKEIEKESNFYNFSYKDYAKRHNQFFTISIDSIEVLDKNTNLFYKVKNSIIKRINNMKPYNYLHAFLLGNTSYIDDQVLESYRINGISHLFAISGMHLTFFICFFYKVLKIDNKNLKFLIVSLFLLFYSWLVGFTPSVLRASLLYIFNFYIKKPVYSLSLAFILIILINPYNLLEIGFQFSFLTSFILIIFSSRIKELTGIGKLLFLTIITFIASVPLMILYFNQINIFTPIYNVFYIAFVSSIVFPLSFVVFFIPQFSWVYLCFTTILEKSSLFFSSISFSIWIMREPNILVFIILVSFTILTLYSIYCKKYFMIIGFFCFILFYHNINYFLFEDYMTVLDVGQGDSLVLHSGNKTVLIDTGGSLYTDIAKTEVIPYLKARGIQKIDVLILTHGDFDHMGEAINLVENFKVGKVIFNCGPYNDLENELIKVLDKKKISYYSCIKELNIGKNKLYFLQTKEYDSENDNSSVVYTELNNHKFLFMGDAGVEVEEDLIEKYSLQDIDVLKVGHHGSKTSSGKEFINEINPQYSIISVGKNNRYGHPNDGVLDNLSKSKIFRTDIHGSVMFKINKNKLKIETCRP